MHSCNIHLIYFYFFLTLLKFVLDAQFLNHPQLTNLFTDDEQQVLQFLKNFFVEEFDDIKNGFKIILKFDSNPYFENETIVKEFHLGTEQPRQVVSPIKWKPGKNFLSSTVPEKESRKRKAPDSFFSWFTSSEPSSSDIISEVCMLIIFLINCNCN